MKKFLLVVGLVMMFSLAAKAQGNLTNLKSVDIDVIRNVTKDNECSLLISKKEFAKNNTGFGIKKEARKVARPIVTGILTRF